MTGQSVGDNGAAAGSTQIGVLIVEDEPIAAKAHCTYLRRAFDQELLLLSRPHDQDAAREVVERVQVVW